MEKLKKLKEKVSKFIVENKKKLEIAALTVSMTFATTIPAVADINGNTIKNNILNNFIGPIFIVLLAFLLIREFMSRNTAKLVITVIIGGFIAIFIYFPDAIRAVMNTMRAILGI